MSISNFAYVGLAVADVGAWARHAEDIFGLQNAGTENGVTALRMDERACRVALHPDARNDIMYAGYEAASAKELAALTTAFKDDGARPMTAEETARRKVAGGIVLKDPDGLDIEIVHGLQNAPEKFQSPRGVTFVTGDQGLGHMVISVTDVPRSLAFYTKLGFKVSDYIDMAVAADMTIRLIFLHCNARHHTLAFLPVPTPIRLNHLMFEVQKVDTVLESYYRAQANKVPIVRHMGRHTNDHMLSYYSQTPAGFDIEFGCEGRPIGPGWKPESYNAISIWGHNP